MTIYQRTRELFGDEHNFTKTIEEAGELIAELCRYRHSRSSFAKVSEEAADLWICLEILQLQLGPAFSQALDAKLDRLAKRLEANDTVVIRPKP